MVVVRAIRRIERRNLHLRRVALRRPKPVNRGAGLRNVGCIIADKKISLLPK